jgi:AraC-like DNA-binding protein
LVDPTVEIAAHQELVVVRNVVRHLGHLPAIGLEAGSRYPLTAYGVWGYALLSSRTFRSAVELGIRYLGLTYVFGGVGCVSTRDELRVLFDDRELPDDCRQFLVERDTAAATAIFRALLGETMPLRRATFRFGAPPWADRFHAVFGTLVFDAPENALVVDAAVADRPLPQANEQTALLCEEQCRRLFDQRHARTLLSERIRRLLLRPGTLPAIEQVAARLGMATRSVQRGLEAEGTTFRSLVGEVRRTLAEEMLARRMTVDEVAERLGYAEAASFVHAFKRWTGVPPGVYRRRSGAGRVGAGARRG